MPDIDNTMFSACMLVTMPTASYCIGTLAQAVSDMLQDVVYFFQPEEDCLVTVSTCNSAQFLDDFDTTLYVLGNATGSGPMGIVSCNDDACAFLSQLQVTAFQILPCTTPIVCTAQS